MTQQVAIINNYEGLNNFLVFIEFKEIFIKKTFKKVKNIIFAMEANMISRYQELELADCKYSITDKINTTDFMDKNSKLIEDTHKDIIKLGLNYSWLQIFQISQIKKENLITTEEAILILTKIYEKLIIKEIEDSI